jgi:cytosine/adenosine deaminase-related metal-dependent hydrolase
MVTIDAARALGMDSQIGSLEVGKKADVVTLGGGLSPHLVPLQMHVHRVVYQAAGQDVNHVVVDGRVLLRDRIPQVMDPVAIQALAEAETVKVIERARLHPFLKPPAGFWGTAVSRLSADDDRAERLPE